MVINEMFGQGFNTYPAETNYGMGCACQLQKQPDGLGFAFIPILIASAISGAQGGAMAFLSRKGPKQKVATSDHANQVEAHMVENLKAWNSLTQSELTGVNKAVALDTFDRLWDGLVEFCGQVSMGNPGHACIADRQRGGKWDWFRLYRDPIEQTPTVDGTYNPISNTVEPTGPMQAQSVITQVEQQVTSGPTGWALLAAMAVVGVYAAKKVL